MITNDNKLKIFENFEVIQRQTTTPGIAIGTGTFITANSGLATFSANDSIQIIERQNGSKKSLLTKFKEYIFHPKRYFNTIKNNVKELSLEDYQDLANGINKIYKDATVNGQTALIEKMNKEKTRIDKELSFIKSGYSKYLLEEDIVKFSKFAKRRIKLDWIKNFVRVIPENIRDKVGKLEKKQLFDNYVILHYDPDDTGTQETEAEIERRKDPIIFGVTQTSRRLYYIGDWIDDYCDLTLDGLLKTMGEKEARKLTSETIGNGELKMNKVKVKKKRVSKKKKK